VGVLLTTAVLCVLCASVVRFCFFGGRGTSAAADHPADQKMV
jgi:hypothetical protein